MTIHYVKPLSGFTLPDLDKLNVYKRIMTNASCDFGMTDCVFNRVHAKLLLRQTIFHTPGVRIDVKCVLK